MDPFLCHPWLADSRWLNTNDYLRALSKRHPERLKDDGLLAAYESMAVLCMAYPSEPVAHKGAGYGRLARYTYGDDYHRMFAEVFSTLESRYKAVGVAAKGYADISPVDERFAAAEAGLGYIGHNQLLIHPELGTYFFIGVLLVDIPTPQNPQAVRDDCGVCRQCVRACPTGALGDVFKIRQCSSYVTQAKIPLTPADVKPLKTVLFGCDICQKVCPKNHHVKPPQHDLFRPDEAAELHLPTLLSQSNKQLQKKYGNYAFMFRGGLVLKRNAFALLYTQNHLASLPLMRVVFAQYAHVPWFADTASWIIEAMEASL
ncbi:MAG: epoxyqueuosine reductase [Acholeplasmatales bacterium]|nr:MAG: epoxyqueuosine reductase [Acholeplasmatales bacterium]